MSIYCSIFDLGFEHETNCRRISNTSKGYYLQDDSKVCTCGSCPIKYAGSTVFPSDKDLRFGSLDLGAIPPHITRDGKDDGDDDKGWHPFLRVGVDDATCVLDRKQVEKLRDAIDKWLSDARSEHEALCARGKCSHPDHIFARNIGDSNLVQQHKEMK